MLNLVQLQERLKDVPMQALMTYANGSNPQVPPFLALGELNRRKKMQESAAAEQAKEMEGAPTVKQQIEQAAGLMALQGNRQQQAARQQQGIQAAMPMAAPNTTTSEPAQLAGGGFIDDIVVPRDYAAGGPIDVEALKRSMYRDTMQGDVADINKELMDAVRKQALRNAPGIPGLPVGRNMFKRGDFAGGGIVAFAGPEGSFVERGPGFYQLEEELPEGEKKPFDMQDVYRQIIQQQMQRKRLQDRIKEAGLEKPPEIAREEFAEMQRSLQEQKARAPMEQLEQLLLGISEARGGTFGTQGAAGAKRSIETEARQRAGITAINQQIAKIKDLREKSAYDAARGNIEKSVAEEQAADKETIDFLSKMSRSQYESALGRQAEQGKITNFSQLMEIIDEAKRNPTPENIRRMNSAITAAGYVTYAAPRVDVQSEGQIAQAEALALREFNDKFGKFVITDEALRDRMDEAAAKDKKAGGGTQFRDQVKLDELNRIRASLRLPSLSRLPTSAAPPTTGGGRPPPPPGFVPQKG